MGDQFYIVDLRPKWSGNPYVTFWRPDNAGYAYPLPWAGKYDLQTVIEGGDYYTTREGRSLIRFAVRCEIVEAMGVTPSPGKIDGDVGPVVLNLPRIRQDLRRAAHTVPIKQKARSS